MQIPLPGFGKKFIPYKSIGNIEVPIIVRLQGTNAAEAKKLIEESGLKVQSAIELSEAASLVAKALTND